MEAPSSSAEGASRVERHRREDQGAKGQGLCPSQENVFILELKRRVSVHSGTNKTYFCSTWRLNFFASSRLGGRTHWWIHPWALNGKRRAITTKVGRRIVHGMTVACTDPEVKRSCFSPNKCNLNLHSRGVGLHVDTTAHFSNYCC